MALLDTTILIDLGRRRSSPLHQRASHHIQNLLSQGQSLFTSRINEAEFRVGAEMSNDRARELQRIERILSGLIILEFNAEAALRYAIIKATLLKRGRPTGDCDMLVASVALANGQSLHTRNPKHFVDVPGLIIETY